MELSDLKKKGYKAVFWNFTGTVLKQGVSFVISIILARLLSPDDFGLVGMATVFIALTQSFSDFGLTSGLIQAKEPTDTQFSTVFYINLGVSVLLMLLMMASAEHIAAYYGKPVVAPISVFVSYTFVINALNGVQLAQLTKALANKTKVMASLISSIVSGIVGIALAYQNYGVWSLVYGTLVGSLVQTGYIWFSSSWRPKWLFSFQEVKPLLHFGSKMFASSMLDTIYTRLDVLIIGKLFPTSTLGYYYRAKSFNQLVITYSSSALQGVYFPIISHLQTDRVSQQKVIEKSLHLISFLSFMLMGLLYLSAEELIVLLFSSKWLPSAGYFRIMVFAAYAYPVSVILVNVLSGNGESGKFLRLEIWKKISGLICLVLGFTVGISGFLVATVISSAIAVLLNMWFVDLVIGWNWRHQVKIVVTYFSYAFVAVLPVYFVMEWLAQVGVLYLVLSSILFVIFFLFINYLMATYAFSYMIKGKLQSMWLKIDASRK